MTEVTDNSAGSRRAPGLVIVGASHCGVQCAFAARRSGFEGPITLLSDESHWPYHRPPLSKDLLTGNKTADQITLRPKNAYAKSDVHFRKNAGVVKIDRDRHQVVINSGERIDYQYLLLATGARPRPLNVDGVTLGNIHYLRTVNDAMNLQPRKGADINAVVIGGGYIGLEAAASLRKIGARVTVVEAMEHILQRVTCAAMSGFYTRLHREEGVDIITGAIVSGFEGEQNVSAVRLADGRSLKANLVVIGIGVIANDELAHEAGLEVNNGIVVDEFAKTSDPHIYAAGDCARGYNALYLKHLRVESVQNANDQGKTAIAHIIGKGEPYNALPWFWSDQYDVKLQIAGLLDGADTLVVRGDPLKGRSFSLCHLQGDVLRAVEAVNQPRDFLGAKALIIAGVRMDLKKLKCDSNAIANCVQLP